MGGCELDSGSGSRFGGVVRDGEVLANDPGRDSEKWFIDRVRLSSSFSACAIRRDALNNAEGLISEG